MIKRWRVSYVLIVIGVVLALPIVADYYSKSPAFSWVGVTDYIKPAGVEERAKTLWDWLDLLIVPAGLAVGGFFLAEKRAEAEREIAADQRQETTLQGYFDRMTELLLEKGLRVSGEKDEVRAVARARTLTTLRGLDQERKGVLLKFLYEAGLIDKKDGVINLSLADLSEAGLSHTDLSGADLSKANLSKANLGWANLRGADLSHADLSKADLRGANLSEAGLREANLSRANLSNADLSKAGLIAADLRGAKLRGANLSKADLFMAYLNEADLRGANLSRANLNEANLNEADLRRARSDKNTIWPDGFDPKQAGVVFIDEESSAEALP